jgi:glycerophosphoryl diester phosphodiesterase
MNFNIFILLMTLSPLLANAKNRKLVIAHRGASGYLPEHTLEAKAAAFMMEADFLEQDLVLTKDFIPIVSHDIHLDEVTNVAQVFPTRNRSDSRYYAIDFTLAEVKQLKVSERFPYNNVATQFFPLRFATWRSSFEISTLEEEIELVQGMEKSFAQIYNLDKNGRLTRGRVRKAGIYPEIKLPQFHRDEGKGNFSEIVLAILRKYGYTRKTDACILQCFDAVELRRIRNELNSELRLVQLLPAEDDQSGYDWNNLGALQEIKKFADGIGPAFIQLINVSSLTTGGSIVQSAYYNEAKRLELFMHPYTFRIDQLPPFVTSYEDFLRLYYDKLGVDGLFTDFPDLTVEYLKLENGSDRTKSGLLLTSVSFVIYLFINNIIFT